MGLVIQAADPSGKCHPAMLPQGRGEPTVKTALTVATLAALWQPPPVLLGPYRALRPTSPTTPEQSRTCRVIQACRKLTMLLF